MPRWQWWRHAGTRLEIMKKSSYPPPHILHFTTKLSDFLIVEWSPGSTSLCMYACMPRGSVDWEYNINYTQQKESSRNSFEPPCSRNAMMTATMTWIRQSSSSVHVSQVIITHGLHWWFINWCCCSISRQKTSTQGRKPYCYWIYSPHTATFLRQSIGCTSTSQNAIRLDMCVAHL